MEYQGASYSYDWLSRKIFDVQKDLIEKRVDGDIIALEGNFSPTTVALLFALIDLDCVILPVSGIKKRSEYDEIYKKCYITKIIDSVLHSYFVHNFSNKIRDIKRLKGRSGLLLLSSGSTGEEKIIVHDFQKFLETYRDSKRNNFKEY